MRGGRRRREAKPAKGINWKAEREKGNCRGRESATRIGCDEVDDACNRVRETEREDETGRERKRKTGGCLSYVKDKEKSRCNDGTQERRRWFSDGNYVGRAPSPRKRPTAVIKMGITFPLMLFTEFAPPRIMN